MSRNTIASLDARIIALEALVAELKTQRAITPIPHYTPSAALRTATISNAEWAAKKAAAIAEAKRTGKSVVMNLSH